MKIFLSLVFVLLCAVSFGQSDSTTHHFLKPKWIETGKTIMVKVTIIWDTVGLPDEKGYCRFVQLRYDNDLKEMPLKSRWIPGKLFYDAAVHPVAKIYSIKFIDPNTGKPEQR